MQKNIPLCFVCVTPENLYYTNPGCAFPGNEHVSQVYQVQNYSNKFTQQKEPYLPWIQWLLCDAGKFTLLEGHLTWNGLSFNFLVYHQSTTSYNMLYFWLFAISALLNSVLHTSNNFYLTILISPTYHIEYLWDNILISSCHFLVQKIPRIAHFL